MDRHGPSWTVDPRGNSLWKRKFYRRGFWDSLETEKLMDHRSGNENFTAADFGTWIHVEIHSGNENFTAADFGTCYLINDTVVSLYTRIPDRISHTRKFSVKRLTSTRSTRILLCRVCDAFNFERITKQSRATVRKRMTLSIERQMFRAALLSRIFSVASFMNEDLVASNDKMRILVHDCMFDDDLTLSLHKNKREDIVILYTNSHHMMRAEHDTRTIRVTERKIVALLNHGSFRLKQRRCFNLKTTKRRYVSRTARMLVRPLTRAEHEAAISAS